MENTLTDAERKREFENKRAGVSKRLETVQALYEQFQNSNPKVPTIVLQVMEKGYTRLINELKSHKLALDTRINHLKTTIQNGQRSNNSGNS